MTRQEFPGGSYPDALPTGERVVLYHGRFLEAHFGVVAFPAGETFGTMFNRIAPDGYRFAGLRHDGGGLAECQFGAWRDVPGPFAGSSPLIYDRDGRLIHDPIVYADGSVSSQGYRYIDEQGDPVSGQDTYATADGQINQFSVYRGVVFGQGHDGGLVVRGPDGITRLLAPESPFDIRVQGVGEVVAVSFWDAQFDGLCAYIYIDTLAAYLACPPLVAAPPVVITPIQPPITPKPEPTPVSIPNQLWIVQTIRTTYPTPLGARHGEFLMAVARATGAKLLRKDAGSHVTLPDGRNVSQDILMFGDQGIDFLSDAEGAAVPSWQEKGQIVGEYYDVSEPNPGTPPPNPGTPEPSDLPQRVADLEATVAKLVAWTRGV